MPYLSPPRCYKKTTYIKIPKNYRAQTAWTSQPDLSVNWTQDLKIYFVKRKSTSTRVTPKYNFYNLVATLSISSQPNQQFAAQQTTLSKLIHPFTQKPDAEQRHQCQAPNDDDTATD